MSGIADIFTGPDDQAPVRAAGMQQQAAQDAVAVWKKQLQDQNTRLGPYAGYGREAMGSLGDLMGLARPMEMDAAESQAQAGPKKYYNSQSIGGYDVPSDVDPAEFQRIFNEEDARHYAKYKRHLDRSSMGTQYATDWAAAMKRIEDAARQQSRQNGG